MDTIYALQEPFINWVLNSSPSLGIFVVLLWAAWHIAAKFKDYEHRFTRIDSDIAGLKSDVKELRSDVDEIKGEVREMKGQIREMSGQIAIVISLLSRKKIKTSKKLKSNHPQA